ncbi:MAG: holo-ACP synthase [Candidatus Omnitrophota bacterium]
MITGSGIDIVEIVRIRAATLKWGDRFLTRILNDEEIAYAQTHIIPYPHYAGRFAAKEAIYKAVGDKTLSWKDITVTNTPDGKPVCHINRPLSGQVIHLSISHSKFYAVASAIVETKE